MPLAIISLNLLFKYMDIWDKHKRSDVMARIRSRDTKPELIVRKFLWSRGYHYRKNVKKLPGSPDIVLRKYGIVIFIHGCFWHGHDSHFQMPKSNVTFWEKKITRNIERDKENKEKLKNQGWRVMTIWECQLRNATRKQTLEEIIYWLNKSYIDRYDIQNKDQHIAAEENKKYIKKNK